MKKRTVKKAVKLDGKSRIPNFYAPFKSLAGKPYASKEEYLVKKEKASSSKFTLGFLVFKEGVKEVLGKKVGATVTIVIEPRIDALIRKLSKGKVTSKGYKYLSGDLLTNRDKGYLGLIEEYDSIKVDNLKRVNVPKTSGNGTVNAPIEYDLVRLK